MNIADLTAKIKIVLEKEDLGKLSEGLENVKKKIQELNKKLKDLSEEQKKVGEQSEKVAEQTEKQTKAASRLDKIIKGLAQTIKNVLGGAVKAIGSTLVNLGFTLGWIAQIVKEIIIIGTSGGALLGTALERMYEKAGKLGASLRLISTDFSLSPQALQQWRMIAEQAGLSFDTMDRMLSVVTEMKRLAIVNPAYLPDVLNLANIRPANFSDPESLLKAILQTSLSSGFKNDQARMAWLKNAGFDDPAAAFLLAKQFAKGGKFDSAFFISNENVEKLKDVNVAIAKINRLSESVKNNFLATISDDFVEQINDICEYIVKTVHAVEGFITKHGGFRKIISDFGGLTSKISKVANSFASMAKFMMSLGFFTSLVVGFGVALGGVLKIADMLVERCATALNLAGSIKEFIAGYVAVSIGDLIATGNIPREYEGLAKDIQSELLNKAGVYKDPAQVAKGINSILTWLKDVGGKLVYTLLDGLYTVVYKAVDYLVDAILRLWVRMDLPFSDKAREVLIGDALRVPEENRTEWQKDLIKGQRELVIQQLEDEYGEKSFPITQGIFGEENKEKLRASRMLASLYRLVTMGEGGSIKAQELVNKINRESLGYLRSDQRKEYNELKNVVINNTINGSPDNPNIFRDMTTATEKGIKNGIKPLIGVSAIGG